MTITAADIEGLGASDYIVLGMCESCDDNFQSEEDEYDLPPPDGYYTDISYDRKEVKNCPDSQMVSQWE